MSSSLNTQPAREVIPSFSGGLSLTGFPADCLAVGLGGLLRQTVLGYQKLAWPLTKPLILPVLSQVVGIYLALWLPNLFQQWLATSLVRPVQAELQLLMVLVAIVVSGPGIYLFVNGFWQYVVLSCSLNLNVREGLTERPVSVKDAYQYFNAQAVWPLVNFLMLLAVVWLLPFAVGGGCLYLALTDPHNAWMWGAICAGLTLCALVALSVFSVFGSLGLQVLAFEPPCANPLQVLRRSYRLVEDRFWTALGLALSLWLITALLIPGAIGLLVEGSGLGAPVQWAITHLVSDFAVALKPPAYPPKGFENWLPMIEMAHQFLTAYRAELSVELTRGLVASLCTSFLLPLGTIAYSLFYGRQATLKPRIALLPEEELMQ
ncbi:MAG: hypothetical protein SFZ03_01295 [Candidatus Melainabacteria bacterium]|nr:hypothetical protein [Candidatus Melainabacteria bacterium]